MKRLLDAEILRFEIGGEDLHSEVGRNFLFGPETTLEDLLTIRFEIEIADGGKYIDQFSFTLGLEFISIKPDRIEIKKAELLPRLTEKGFNHIFAIRNVASDSSIPAQGEKILGGGTVLEIDVTVAVDDS